MQGIHLRKYGVEAKIPFVLYEIDGVDLRVDAADAGSDCSMMKDEGAEATCTNDFVDEGKGYSITLTLTEMQAARIVVYIVDSATKVWLDDSLIIETYGHASAQHAFDLDTAATTMRGTDNASLAVVVGALADAAAAGEVTEADTLMKYIKQLINILIGTPGIVTFPAEAAPANGVSMAEVLRAIAVDVQTTIPGTISTAQTELDKIGTVPALDGAGQTIGAAIGKLADDNAGADYDAGTDSLQKIRDRGDAAWAGAPESVSGTIAVATADTIFDLTATVGTLSTADDTYNNMIICILDNSGSIYETARITDYDGTGLTRITIDHELTFPVEDGVDTFVIYRAAYAPVGAASITEGDMNTIVDKVHDELVSEHQTAGSAGYHLKRAGQRY